MSFLPYGQLGMDGANAAAAALAERPEMLSDALKDMLSVSGVTVVADLPAGPSSTLAAALRHAALMVVPLVPDPASVSQVPAIEAGRFGGVGAANGLQSSQLRYVINKWGMPGRLASAIGQGCVQQLSGRLLGAVRYDEAVPESLAAQRLLGDFAPTLDAARDMAGLAAAIMAQIAAFRITNPVAELSQKRPQPLRNTQSLSSLADILPGSRPPFGQKANR